MLWWSTKISWWAQLFPQHGAVNREVLLLGLHSFWHFLSFLDSLCTIKLFMILCLFYGQGIKFKLHLEWDLLSSCLICKKVSSSKLIFLGQENHPDLNDRLEKNRLILSPKNIPCQSYFWSHIFLIAGQFWKRTWKILTCVYIFQSNKIDKESLPVQPRAITDISPLITGIMFPVTRVPVSRGINGVSGSSGNFLQTLNCTDYQIGSSMISTPLFPC